MISIANTDLTYKITAEKVAQQNCYLDFDVMGIKENRDEYQKYPQLRLHSVRVKEIETGQEILAFTVESDGVLTKLIETAPSGASAIGNYANFGFPFIIKYLKPLGYFYELYYYQIPLLYCYESIGWHENFGGKLYFHGADLINFTLSDVHGRENPQDNLDGVNKFGPELHIWDENWEEKEWMGKVKYTEAADRISNLIVKAEKKLEEIIECRLSKIEDKTVRTEFFALLGELETDFNKELGTRQEREQREEREIIQDLYRTLDGVVTPTGFDNGKLNFYTLSDSSSHLKKSWPSNLQESEALQASVDLFNKVIQGRISAQIALAMGFASLLVGLLRSSTFILNICGESSSGKSIISQLATSIYGATDTVKITGTFDSTPKALETLMHNNNGIVVVIDDTSTGYDKEHNVGRLIYNLAKGTSRKRLGKDFKINPSLSWNTTIITSSEKSMFETTDKDKLGVLRRCIEIILPKQEEVEKDPKQAKRSIFENEEMAEKVRAFTKDTYGILGSELINRMRDAGLTRDKIKSMFDEESKFMQSEFKKKLEKAAEKDPSRKKSFNRGINMGYAETAAHITLIATIAKDYLNINFEAEALREHLLQLGMEIIDKFDNEIKKASYTDDEIYEELCTVENKQFKYGCGHKDCTESNDVVNIPVQEFNDLAQNKFGVNPKQLKQYLKSNGLLVSNRGRLDHSIHGVRHFSIKI